MRTSVPHVYRHARTPVYRDSSNRLVLGMRTRVSLGPGDDFLVHAVGDGERLDGIAFRYYGDHHLAWLLADVNGIDAPWDIPATIKVPTTSAVAAIINRAGRR